jgi:DNA polymerase (family 10)
MAKSKTGKRSDAASKSASGDKGVPTLTKNDVARILDEVSVMLEISGANAFKVRAYYNGARAVEEITDDLSELVESKELLDVRGVGKSIFRDIESLLATGSFDLYDELRENIPEGVRDMLRISGMGPKKVKAVYDELGVDSVDALEHAGRAGQLADLPGFGEKTQTNILRGIAQMRKYQDRFLYHKALEAAEYVHEYVKDLEGVKRSLIGGSLRRCKETIGDVDILVSAEESGHIMDEFTSLDRVATVVAKGETKSSVVLGSGIAVDLRVVKDEQFAFASHYFTGSKAHNTEIRARAKKRGYKLNEYGLFEGEKPTSCREEADIFAALGLDFIPPELRENNGEIDAAENHELPALVDQRDIRGVFHCHTTYSDGHATLKEMVDAARALGHKFFGTGDHSQGAVYAEGMSVEKVKEQRKEIDWMNDKSAGEFVVFHGTESDIHPDGALDYPDEVLATFDYVVASIHGNFNLSEAEQTRRLIKAIENPFTTMIGHPTGRLLLSREGYDINLHAVIEAAAANDVLLEINAHPNRLDLDWRHCRAARDAGVLLVINPDSHSTDGIADTRFGVGVARKGWLEKKDLLNTRTPTQVRKFFQSRKKKKGIQ